MEIKILATIALLFIIIYYGEKILSSYLKYQVGKYSTPKAKFVSELFKLQYKWSKKGFYEYSELIDAVIKSLNLPPEEHVASTEYGRNVQSKIKDLENEED